MSADGLVDADVWPDDTAEWVTTLEPVMRPVTVARWERPTVIVHLLARDETAA